MHHGIADRSATASASSRMRACRWRLRAQFPAADLEALTVFGQVDRVGRGAEDRDAGFFEGRRQFQRRLAAQLHDHALERAVCCSTAGFPVRLRRSAAQSTDDPTCRNRSTPFPGCS